MNPRDAQTRAENVGSFLRSPEALRAARSHGPGDLGIDDPVLDAAVLDVLRLQRDSGVDVVTDGELRRSNWADTPDFLDCFDKVAGNTGGLRWRGGENTPSGGHAAAYDTVARRVAAAKRRGDRAAQYAFLAGHADGARTKFTLPAPSYHRRYWWEEVSGQVYRSAEEYLTEIRDALREVVDQVVELGGDYIQLDAPNYGSLCDPGHRAWLEGQGVDVDAQIAFDAALDSSLFAGLTGVTRAVHVCRGNAPGGRWHSSGGYGVISAELFPRLEVDRLLLEYDTERAGTFGPLADVPSGVTAVLGLLTTKSGELEDEAAVRERIAEAATVKALDELALSTQCGFASVAGGNVVTQEQQQAKLRLVARVARATWPAPEEPEEMEKEKN